MTTPTPSAEKVLADLRSRIAGHKSWIAHDQAILNNPAASELHYCAQGRVADREQEIVFFDAAISLIQQQAADARDIHERAAHLMGAMAGTIADLQEQVQSLQAQSQWVAVSERLPERQTDVLGFMPGNDADDHSIESVFYHDTNGCWKHSADYTTVHCRVTHWMPLPSPPTGASQS